MMICCVDVLLVCGSGVHGSGQRAHHPPAPRWKAPVRSGQRGEVQKDTRRKNVCQVKVKERNSKIIRKRYGSLTK